MNVFKEPNFPLRLLLLLTKFLKFSSLYYDSNLQTFNISGKWKRLKFIWTIMLCVLCVDLYVNLINMFGLASVSPTRKITLYFYAFFGIFKFHCYVICVWKYDCLNCDILNNLYLLQAEKMLKTKMLKFRVQRIFTFYLLIVYVLFFTIQWIYVYMNQISFFIFKMTVYTHYRKYTICIVDGQFMVMYLILGEHFTKLNMILTNIKKKSAYDLIKLIEVHQKLRVCLKKSTKAFSLIILMSLFFNFYVISRIITKFALVKAINGGELLEIFITAGKILWIILIISQCTQEVK